MSLETKELRIRVTEEQYSIIMTRAQLCGCYSISAYVRDKLLRTPHWTEQMLIEIYYALRGRTS
ncbi:hypothetical protein JXA85_08440 [Candidatus Woesearchaeota archaeon]|nr:hypothetical protein [Candidatus Woesearchaeota archaeon]